MATKSKLDPVDIPRARIGIAYEIELSKPGAGAADTLHKGVVILNVKKVIQTHYNIPEFTGTEGGGDAASNKLPFISIAAFSYQLAPVGDQPGKTINVPAYTRTVGGKSGKKTMGKSVVLPRDNAQYTRQYKGRTLVKNRTFSLSFPSEFSVHMIRQAIGTMLKVNQPAEFRVDNTRYPFIPLTSSARAEGAKEGAWIVTTVPAGFYNTERPAGAPEEERVG